MLSQDLSILINTIITLIESIVVVITLIYIVKQTSSMQKSLNEIEKDRKLETLLNMKSQTQEINKVLLNDPSLAKVMGFSKEDILGFMLLHDLEQSFFLKEGGYIDESRWQSDKVALEDAVNKDFVRLLWQKYKGEYHPGFVALVDPMIKTIDKRQKANKKIKTS